MDSWRGWVESGRHLAQAFDLLARANEVVWPTTAALVTKAGLLAEARNAADRAKAALGQ